MRTTELWNNGWYFSRQDCGHALTLAHGEAVTLPHTWNAKDGTDGGNDYYRGRCWYVKKFAAPALADGEQLWIELRGAAMTAEVFLNGQKLVAHSGGYSTFRAELTPALAAGKNLLAVSVDNSANDTVYPQKADFTFYGGLYRDVYLLCVPTTHFALGYHGAPGIRVTPKLSADFKSAEIVVEAWVEGPAEHVRFTLGDQTLDAKVLDGHAESVFHLENVHLWDGLDDPYLYTAKARLDSGDCVTAKFGVRSFAVDPEKGFILNGRRYPLCGAARHQDRAQLGNALTVVEHEEDMALIREMGANTIRLAHYQHDQYFYDLCDQYGMIVWAEIPYITQHMPNGRENTLNQMRELIVQNYNHPCIVSWGISNEITASGMSADLVENHRLLNDLCHSLDSTRPTAMAHAFMLDPEDPLVFLPDICSYNLYYGWYLGELEQNDEFFDTFHTAHPDIVIGLSEYGADANTAYQNSCPHKGDWSEGYQAIYHEHLLKMWSERPYIWAMHCWNMFDFGADGRSEGGKPGQNQKGLVTFDRKIKKDAFYLYKAYLSKAPFVHLCGRRYRDRAEQETEIKVYSNQSAVTLLVDGKEFETQTGDKIFRFVVPITAEHTITAMATADEACNDSIIIRKVKTANPAYFAEGTQVINWFDKPEELLREGYYSILDSMEELKKNPQSAALLAKIMEKASASYGDVAKSIQIPEAIRRQMDKMPLQKMLEQAGKAVPPAMAKELNAALNQIAK